MYDTFTTSPPPPRLRHEAPVRFNHHRHNLIEVQANLINGRGRKVSWLFYVLLKNALEIDANVSQ